jgi:hypothetical protein
MRSARVVDWQTPKEPQTAKIIIRVHDDERLELVDEASFLVTTTKR